MFFLLQKNQKLWARKYQQKKQQGQPLHLHHLRDQNEEMNREVRCFVVNIHIWDVCCSYGVLVYGSVFSIQLTVLENQNFQVAKMVISTIVYILLKMVMVV